MFLLVDVTLETRRHVPRDVGTKISSPRNVRMFFHDLLKYVSLDVTYGRKTRYLNDITECVALPGFLSCSL